MPLPATIWVDSITLRVAAPTLLDKRSRIRSQVVSIPSQALDVEVMTQFCDIFLQTHMRTRARGDITVTGRAVREYKTGRPVAPFSIGELVGELICLAAEIDPDTGYIGRCVSIAQVSYSGNDEKVSISLDDSRDDFEKIVSRYGLISGGGS